MAPAPQAAASKIRARMATLVRVCLERTVRKIFGLVVLCDRLREAFRLGRGPDTRRLPVLFPGAQYLRQDAHIPLIDLSTGRLALDQRSKSQVRNEGIAETDRLNIVFRGLKVDRSRADAHVDFDVIRDL